MTKVQVLTLLAFSVIGLYQFLKKSNNKIDVHLIAHSHDDVGWLKTPE